MALLPALQQLPTLFAQAVLGKDKVFACVQMSEDAKALDVWCADSNDQTFRASFDEKALTQIRATVDGSLKWENFFKGIEEGFNQRKVVVSAEAGGPTMSLLVECLLGGGAPSSGKKCTFRLEKTGDPSGCQAMLNAMHDFYLLRTRDKWKEERMGKLDKEMAELEKKVQELSKEQKDIEAQLASADANEKQTREQLKKLEAELKDAEGDGKGTKRDAPESWLVIDDDLEPPAVVARVPLRDALGRVKEAKDFDLHLMRLVKSKFTPLTDEEAAMEKMDTDGEYKHMRVVRPFTASEYAAQMAGLTDKGKQLVLDALKKIDDWDFDVFTLQCFTNGGSLFVVSYALFLRYNFLAKFRLDEKCVINFLSQAEAGYQPNPYHNSTHASDVLHILHYILSPGGLIKTAKLTEEDQFAALIAALIHDYDHPGINNNFHVKTQSYLARLYNDRSILENHHAAEIFELMKDARFDVLSGLSHEQKKEIRETIIEMVLSTDMGLHSKILSTFKRRIAEDKEFVRKDDVRLALSMGIKMADISNCGRPEHLYLKWASKIADEFFMQGDRERNLGIPVSPFMDRRTPSMAKGQIAFMNYIVVPLFESISEYLPDMHFSVDHVESNKSYWAQNDDSAL